MSPQHKALIRRYLVWAYKNTKEAYDRLERKTTQLTADEFIWAKLSQKSKHQGRRSAEYQALLAEFKDYVEKKRAQAVPKGQHLYLQDRLDAVEAAIKDFLGQKELRNIRASYEEEFTRRIWASTEH